MIISGGENIVSSEVERAVSELPDMSEGAVIELPDPSGASIWWRSW
jgi:fatty-acyl-CoA synthase